MVFFSSQIPDRTDCISRLPAGPGYTEKGHHADASEDIPLGLNKQHWIEIVKVLRIPHFSHTKKLDLIHEPKIPVIYGKQLLPVVPHVDSLFTRGFPSEPVVRIAIHLCPRCYEEDMRLDSQMDLMVCAICGHEEIREMHEHYKKASRKMETARKLSSNFYKRIVHFRYWMRRLQGKEKHSVTSEDIEKVRQLLIKDNLRGVHYWNVRSCLQRLKMQRHYAHCVYIMSRIRGKPLVNLTKNQEQVLIEMFMKLQEPFSLLTSKRVNMLSYPYVLKKLCELKGWFNMARIIPTLKSGVRIMMQDQLWKEICEFRGWRFIPTPQWSFLDTRGLSSKPR